MELLISSTAIKVKSPLITSTQKLILATFSFSSAISGLSYTTSSTKFFDWISVAMVSISPEVI